jgi:alpha-aminoadipic semialdehyde synthase
LVQPCTKRIFTNKEFAAAGAVIQEDLSDACLVIGVKQMPIDFIEGDKNYMFFSHVIKAQPKNMPLLDRILEKKARLFDYECITKGGLDDSPRLVAFGKYAGIAGMIDCLQGLGQRLLAEGYSTPFLNMPLSYMFPNLDQARVAIRGVGSQIEGAVGLPDGISPLVFAFTGNGNVAKGAREMFELLPHEWISVEELPTLKDQVLSGKRNKNRVYGVIVEAVDMVAHPDGKQLSNKADYYANPQNYVPIFHEKVAPYISVLVNCMYWDSRYPRLLTNPQIAKIRRDGNKNLRFLADITCDVGGSVEFLVKSTMIEKPFYSFSPESGTDSDELNGTDIGIAGVDILPSELPRDASEHFGNALMPLLTTILKNKGAKDVADMTDIPPELRRACIASHGELQPKWKYIELLRQKREQQEKEMSQGLGQASSGAVITKIVEMRVRLQENQNY